MTRPVRRSRRELLALAGFTGTVALAGCSALDGLLGEPTVDGSALVDVVSGERPGIRETVPVDVERRFAASHRDRAESLLSSVPVPLDRTDVPNGVVREGIADRHDEAREELGDLQIDEPDVETLNGAEFVRGHARAAAASWAGVTDELTGDTVRDETSSIRSDIDAFRERWRYVGDDPVEAVVTYHVLERWLRGAPRTLTTPRGGPDVLWLGEFASNVERARTGVENLDYLFDRHLTAQRKDRPLREGFLDATERVAETVARRERDLPGDALADAQTVADRGGAETPADAALAHLASSIGSVGSHRYHRYEWVASPLLAAHQDLAEIGAFEWLHERVEAGEHLAPTEIEDVRRLRSAAVEELETADGGPTPHLARQVLSGAAATISHVDERLREKGAAADDGVSVGDIRYRLGEYVRARGLAEAVGEASEILATELRSE